MKVFVVGLIILSILAISYFITAGLFWIVCIAFGLEFSWLKALGIFSILILLKSVFNNKKD